MEIPNFKEERIYINCSKRKVLNWKNTVETIHTVELKNWLLLQVSSLCTMRYIKLQGCKKDKKESFRDVIILVN